MHKDLRRQFAEKFAAARNQTLALFDLADEAVLHQSPGFGFRPILWHLAHIGAFEEYWILNRANNAATLNERFQIIFDPIKTPRENSKQLPTKAEMLAYLETVRANVLRVLDDFNFNTDDALFKNGYVFDLVHQHELQHQETLAYLFHLLPLEKVQSPKSKVRSPKKNFSKLKFAQNFSAAEVTVGAAFNEFAYDNELPAQTIFVPAFKLDKFLTTNDDFAEFIAEKGYERKEFWSADGWEFCQKENLHAPLFWTENAANDWRIRSMFAENSLAESADFPVYGVSFYEAEAYARFCGKRLPTEFEWERAALVDSETNKKQSSGIQNAPPENCNFGFKFWRTTPVHQFADNANIADLAGNLWEFTSSDFAPYPNFRAFPYEDYSQKWFDGEHKVLKGGSFATSPEILRTSFRNFFRKNFRIAFAGIRLAENA